MSESEDGEVLKIVDAFDLDDELRSILRPGEMVRDDQGRRHRLPRYFYEVPSHDAAMKTRLTTNFGLNEFILVDLKEAPRLQDYPRYIPCAVRVLAFYLQQFRVAAQREVEAGALRRIDAMSIDGRATRRARRSSPSLPMSSVSGTERWRCTSFAPAGVIEPNVWTHVACVHDGSFWRFLKDRIYGLHEILPLPELMRQAAQAAASH